MFNQSSVWRIILLYYAISTEREIYTNVLESSLDGMSCPTKKGYHMVSCIKSYEGKVELNKMLGFIIFPL